MLFWAVYLVKTGYLPSGVTFGLWAGPLGPVCPAMLGSVCGFSLAPVAERIPCPEEGSD